MEPFRPWVDEVVYTRQGAELDKDFKRELIDVPNRMVKYQKRRMSLDLAVDQYVLEVTGALKDGTIPQGEMEFDS